MADNENNNQEHQALEEIKAIEGELQSRLDEASEKAKGIIADAREKAAVLIKEKESELAELRQTLVQDNYVSDSEEEETDQISTPTALVQELAAELFEMVTGEPNTKKGGGS